MLEEDYYFVTLRVKLNVHLLHVHCFRAWVKLAVATDTERKVASRMEQTVLVEGEAVSHYDNQTRYM